MKNYWGNWSLVGLAIIFMCITFLSTCSIGVSARRTRSSRHHKTKHSDASVVEVQSTSTLSSSDNNLNETTGSTLSPLLLKSEKWRMESNDVCQGWWCGHGRECQRGTDGLPSCICMRECPDKPPTTNVNREGNSNNKNGYLEYGKGFEEFYEPFPDSELIFPRDTIAVRLNDNKPVCGSDGKIYPNQCELYRTACITNHPYLHVDDSEESCRHTAPGGRDDGKEGSYGGNGGRDQDEDRRGGKGNGGRIPGVGGAGGSQDNPFGQGPSFFEPGADFPHFPAGDRNIPSFGGIDIPFGSTGGDGFGQPDQTGNQRPGADEVDKFRPQKGRDGMSTSGSRNNEKDKATDGTKSHGKIMTSSKNTGFGSGAEAAAKAASVKGKWALPEMSRFSVEDVLSEEDDDEDEDEDEDDLDLDDEDDYSNEYSFLDESKLALLDNSGTVGAEAAMKASLGPRLSGRNKPTIGGRRTMDGISIEKGKAEKRNSLSNSDKNKIRYKDTTDDEAENEEINKGKMKKKRKSMRNKTSPGIDLEPSESQWDEVPSSSTISDSDDDSSIKSGSPAVSSTHNNLAHNQKKSNSHWHKDKSWKIDFINKKSASQDSPNLSSSSYFTPSFSSSSSSKSFQKEMASTVGDSTGRGVIMGSANSFRNLKSDGKTFLPNARIGSSLCSREEYEILKEALLIYNHHHLIDEKKSKKQKSSHHKKNVNTSFKDTDDNEDDKDDETLDVDDNDDEDDSNEGETVGNDEDDAASQERKSTFGRKYDKSTFEKEYLLSLMFAHFDQNNNGKLDYAELQKVMMTQKIGRPSLYCHLVEMIRFDDMDHDGLISPSEFYAAFKGLSVLGARKPRSPIHLTARVGEVLEIKCSVGAGSVSGAEQKRRKFSALPSFSNDNDDDNDLKGNEREDDSDYNNDLGGNGVNSKRRKARKSFSSTTPSIPTTQWYRYGVDVSKLINLGEQFQIHKDGTLLINRVELIHAGNYSCHDDSGNEKVVQPYVLQVQMAPDVKVRPHIKWERPGQDVSMECRTESEPQPMVQWLKNDNPIIPSENKYTITGDGITLNIKEINFSDTGAYMCQSENEAGKRIDISSLVVINEQALPPVQFNESQFLVFHDRGISTYDPENCRLQHQILHTDIIPGTQRDYICGSSSPSSCEWGRAVRVSNVYVYASQPKLNRVLIISISQIIVVDVVSTDRFPVELHYVPQVDQVWIECWREEEPYTTKTLQVIRGAKEKRKHRAIRPKPLVSLEADLVQNVFLPPAHSSFLSPLSSASPSASFWHAYVSHKNTRGLYKLNLKTLRYTKSIDLTSYNCLPEQVHFTALYGFIILECKEPVLHQPTGQLVLDSISDAIISYKADLNGASFLSPDSRKLVTMLENPHDRSGGSTLLLQHVDANGLRIAFDVNTSLNISDVAFFPSQRFHSYDLYATSVDKEDVLFVDLNSGDVELVPGVGRALQNPSWERIQRPIASEDLFGKYLVTPSSNAVYVINGKSHTVNCQIGGMTNPSMVVWL